MVIRVKWTFSHLQGKASFFSYFKILRVIQSHRDGSRGRVQGVHLPPPPPISDMTFSFLIQLVFCKKKNCVVYWCRGKRWDKVEEFMINTAKMIVKMVVPRPPININVSVMYSMDSANPVAVNVNVTRKTYFYWTLFHGVPSVSMQGTEHPRSSFGPVFNL